MFTVVMDEEAVFMEEENAVRTRFGFLNNHERLALITYIAEIDVHLFRHGVPQNELSLFYQTLSTTDRENCQIYEREYGKIIARKSLTKPRRLQSGVVFYLKQNGVSRRISLSKKEYK